MDRARRKRSSRQRIMVQEERFMTRRNGIYFHV
jgi:hypothetical protein